MKDGVRRAEERKGEEMGGGKVLSQTDDQTASQGIGLNEGE